MTQVLEQLAAELRREEAIAPHVRDSDAATPFGSIAAAGPRGDSDREAYEVLFEAIREGYLLHYGTSRLLDGADPDLRLLAGDYLYALGLESLASRGDLAAVRELGDLISLSAELHARGGEESLDLLWTASAAALASGGGAEHERAKAAVRSGDPAAPELLDRAIAEAADSIGFDPKLPSAGANDERG